MNATLYYVHDPMCSWCWGYRPTWEAVLAGLPQDVRVRMLLGGLAPDSNIPMPPELQATVQGHWRRIAAELGTEFNFDFWTRCTPRRSTYPACRAVLAARGQGREDDMILAIQQAYYLRAMNPSDLDTLMTLANETALDAARFRLDMGSADLERELQAEMARARALPIRGFPSLVLEFGAKPVAIRLDYRDAGITLDHVSHVMQLTDPHPAQD